MGGVMLLSMACARRGWLTVGSAACALLALSCRGSGAGEGEQPSPAASEASRASRLKELTAKYAAKGLAERMQAAVQGCYVGSNCQPIEYEALLAGADDDSERAALRATARPVFARQYEAALLAQKKKVESVSAMGKGNSTLRVKGPVCSRFFLENFAVRPEGGVAKRLRFERIECTSRAIQVKLKLDPAR